MTSGALHENFFFRYWINGNQTSLSGMLPLFTIDLTLWGGLVVLRALPLGISSFRNLRKDDRIYVDKTDLVFSMVQNQSRVFLTRPRRFGKSLLVSTLEALFGRGLEDFQGLKIAKLWKEDKQYKVVRLDFSQISSIKLERFELNFSVHLVNAFGQFGFECALNVKSTA